AAHRTLGISADLELLKAHLQGIVQQQSANQRRALAENQFHRLSRLNTADQAGQNTQDSTLGTARYLAGRRRFRVKATVTRTLRWKKHRCLTVKPKDAAVNIRFPQQDASIVDQVARREIVGAVDDDVVRFENRQRIGRRQARFKEIDLDLRIDGAKAL